MTAPARPVLRYHGGKWRLASWIISHFPPHRIYTETFGGAGSVLMQKPRVYAEVYNDLDEEVVNLFRILRGRDSAAELERLLRLTPFARQEFEDSYLPDADPIERARKLVLRCFMGFGSTAHNSAARTGFRQKSYRSNQTGVGDWRNYPDAVQAMSERLQGVLIENKPAIEILGLHDSYDTLHYVDPPYPHQVRQIRWPSDAKAFYTHEMTDDEHRELAEVLLQLEGMVVLSGYACPLYDEELFPDWTRVIRSTIADGARKRVEVLWLNKNATKGIQGDLLRDHAEELTS